ncbi:MAG: hypothetical protein WC292_07610, partial [Clostridia bacterium]
MQPTAKTAFAETSYTHNIKLENFVGSVEYKLKGDTDMSLLTFNEPTTCCIGAVGNEAEIIVVCPVLSPNFVWEISINSGEFVPLTDFEWSYNLIKKNGRGYD